MHPPVLMPVWLILIVVGLIIAMVAWYVFVFTWTRADNRIAIDDIPLEPAQRAVWLSKIDALQERAINGDISLRQLHVELAAVMRGYASARAGRDLSSCTVRDLLDQARTTGPLSISSRLRAVLWAGRPLDENPLGRVGELLALFEQPSFDRDPRGAITTSCSMAREVIHR
ncbi:hypothetical protein [Actinomyces vulturis]|uniref:hypothetical protein n=1 Tax=Actinomyces vulturis TaxID=1857645 RepID=UPI0009F2D923|nr:hypothetical protein [Actinomyces vulturis]